MRKHLAVLAVAALAAFAAVPSAQAQTRFHGGFHGGVSVRVGPGYGYGYRGWGHGYYGPRYYGPGYWGPRYYGPWLPPVIVAPPVVVAPPAYDQHPPFTTQVPVQEWNGNGYVTVYRTVTAYYDYNTGRYYYVLNGQTYWLQ